MYFVTFITNIQITNTNKVNKSALFSKSIHKYANVLSSAL